MAEQKPSRSNQQLHIQSKVVHGNRGYDVHTGAISFPIYQSTAFRHPGLGQSTGYDYSREKNPTRDEVEDTVCSLEGGCCGLAFASGMAAIGAVLHLFRPGDHLLVSQDLYGGTYRLLEILFRDYGIEATYADTRDLDLLQEKIRGNTRGIFVETPTNPMMRVTDLRRLGLLCKEQGIRLVVDNTFLTPVFQRPLAWGADLVIHSGSKYLGGHNDTIAGFVVTADEETGQRLALIQKTIGSGLSPFDSWLVLRGIKTLALRMERHESNAQTVARWLQDHPAVETVYYVGLPGHPGHDVCRRQADGFGGMISFRLKEAKGVPQILEKVRMILFAESLGGTETLITYPKLQTHGDIPEEQLAQLGIDDRLLRLSVGIEQVRDIIDDLEQAMEGLGERDPQEGTTQWNLERN